MAASCVRQWPFLAGTLTCGKQKLESGVMGFHLLSWLGPSKRILSVYARIRWSRCSCAPLPTDEENRDSLILNNPVWHMFGGPTGPPTTPSSEETRCSSFAPACVQAHGSCMPVSLQFPFVSLPKRGPGRLARIKSSLRTCANSAHWCPQPW